MPAPVPPPARATTSSAAASGITARPSSRYGLRTPRYTVTTSQTKRLSDPAHVPHGNPFSRVACTASSAVCASQPSRTPQIAARSAAPARRSVAEVADGGLAVEEQRRPEEELSHRRVPPSSAARGRRLEVVDLTLEPLQLQRDDHDVDEHEREDDAVRGGDVLLGGAHAAALPQLAQPEVEPLARELEPVERVRENDARRPARRCTSRGSSRRTAGRRA